MRHPLAFGPVILAAGVLASAPAFGATQIGVTSAVLPAARGTPPSEPTRVLQVGLDMQANERVQTDAAGKAHLVFLDGSALSVGPNSDLVLDEYVYDPATQTGKIALSATRGVFRLVGGKISKTTPVTLRTPSATIGVRGGIATASVGETVTASFLYGEEMTVTGGGETQSVTRPGFQIVTGPDGAPNPPTPIPEQTLSNTLDAFEGNGEPPPGAPQVSDEDVANTQLAGLNSLPGAVDVAPAAGGEGAPPALPADDETREASRLGQQEGFRDALADAPGGGGSSGGGSSGDGGGAQPPTLLGTYFGRIKRESGAFPGTDDADPASNLALTDGTIANGIFSAQAGGQPFVIDAALGAFAANSAQQPFGPSVLTGGGLLTPEQDFLLYYLFDQTELRRVVAFAGLPTPPANVPNAGVWSYTLLDDFVRGQTLPLIEDPDATVILPRAFVNWGGAARTVGSAAIVIDGQGASQQSATYVLTGLVQDDAAGRPFISGRLWGQRRTGPDAALDPTTLYRGPIASSDAGDGSDFFGADAPRNFVLEAALVDSADQTLVAGATQFADVNAPGTTYFPNAPAVLGSPFATESRTTRTLNGFAAALELRFDGNGAFQSAQRLASFDSSGVQIFTDASQNRVTAAFYLGADNDESSVEIAFGGSSDGSAFIDDRRFMAQNDGVVVIDGEDPAPGYFAMVTSSELQHNNFLPSGVSFCQCDYLVWGFFAGSRDRSDITTDKRVVELGTWVAGELSNVNQIVGIAPQSATYSGHVIAGVNNAGSIYQAVGAMSLNFTFGGGSFALDSVSITNFDGADLSGVNTSGPGFTSNSFDSLSFGIAGVHPTAGSLSASIDGAFFGPGAPPMNAGGTIQISNDANTYRAHGTFATQRP